MTQFLQWVVKRNASFVFALLLFLALWTKEAYDGGATVIASNSENLWELLFGSFSPWGSRLANAVCYLVSALLLSRLVDNFGLSRERTLLATTLFLLGCGAFPFLSAFQPGSLALPLILGSLGLLFTSYQQPSATGAYFWAFGLLGIATLFFPKLLAFTLAYLLCGGLLRSLNAKSFGSACLGLLFPYWMIGGFLFFFNQLHLLYLPLQKLMYFQPIDYSTVSFTQWIALGFTFYLFISGLVHFMNTSFLYKIKVQNLYYCWIVLYLFCGVAIVLQPQELNTYLPLLVAVSAVFEANLLSSWPNRPIRIAWIVFFILLMGTLSEPLWMDYLIS